MKSLIFILSLFLSWVAHGENDTFPEGCEVITPLNQPLFLKSEKPMLAFIHNRSATTIWITHPVSNAGASAGWSSQLAPNHWSALVVYDKAFELSCVESKPGHEQQLPCANVLAICKWQDSNALLPTHQGTYWAGEDKTLPALISFLKERAIIRTATN